MTHTLLISGAREWWDRRALEVVLKGIIANHDDVTFRHGDAAQGPDRMVREFVERTAGHWKLYCRRVEHDPMPANWRPHGIYNPMAGKLRNTQMIHKGGIDEARFFICGKSSGTRDCLEKAEAAGIPCRVYESPPKATRIS